MNRIDEIISAANSGNADSQNQLGDAYYDGIGVEQDYIQALEWYLRAAKQGHGIAQYNVAYAYANGIGTQKNTSEAIKWFGKSADQGVALALYVLAKMLIDGQFIEQDITKGLDLLQKASDQGLDLAHYDLGTIFLEGRIVVPDVNKGISFLVLSAEQGNKDAQYNLGLVYFSLPEPDYASAEKYLREASFNGHFKAMFELSRLYAISTRDYRHGLLWAIVALEYCEKQDEQRITRIKNNLESKLSTAECDAVSFEARNIIATLDASLS
ncbi:MAG: sel1 repeat family protein [Candidatus Cloacimonetes bacterium]|nr:sel1 repeat family protein [Candidatus Cloacimonadota bacterium]